MKQHDLRMLGLFAKTSGDCDRLCDREVTAKVVLSRLLHLAGCNEVGLLEILQGDRDDWVVQDLCISSLQGFRQFRHGLSLDKYRADSLQGYVTIWLHRHDLVEFWRIRQIQIEGVTFSELITWIALVKPDSWSRRGNRSRRGGRHPRRGIHLVLSHRCDRERRDEPYEYS